MTFKRALMSVAVVVAIGAAFYAGMATERSGIDVSSAYVVSEAQALPPEGKETFTLCDLRLALTNLEEAFGYFADVLDGVWCSGVDCGMSFELPEDVKAALDLLDEAKWFSGGRDKCQTDPCFVAKTQYRDMVDMVLTNAHATGAALDQVLGGLKDTNIQYLSEAGQPKRR